MEMILPLMNFLKEMKNNGIRTEDQNEKTENNQNLNLNNNQACLENRKNQRNTGYFDFQNSNPNLNGCGNAQDNLNNCANAINSQNINNNYNGNCNNLNTNANSNSNSNNNIYNSGPNTLNSECMKMLTHLFLQSQNQNLNLSNINNLISNNHTCNSNSNAINNNNNNSAFNGNNNFNNTCNNSLNSLNNSSNINNNNFNYNFNNMNNNTTNSNSKVNSHNNNNQNLSTANNSNACISSNNNSSINLNSLFNMGAGNNGLPDFLKASNLISELINLEEQNRVQIDLIQKIIDTRYKNNSTINSALLTMLANNNCDFGFNNGDSDRNEGATTKSSSKLSENTDNKNSNKSSSFNNSGNAESQLQIKVENHGVANTLLSKKTLRDPRQNLICGHLEKKHYAKGMCNNCYHSNGRNKKAWKCSHTEKSHYALGVCQTCYQSKYTSKAKKALEDVKSHSSHNDSDSGLEEKEIDQIKYNLVPLEEQNNNVNSVENICEKNEKENVNLTVEARIEK